MPASQTVSLEAAYLLHSRPFKDSALLIEVFTPNFGRVGLVANGVRKKKGRWQSALQPFVPILISWRGRSELQTVTDVETSGTMLGLTGKYLMSAFYINELLTYLLHRYDGNPWLFQRYEAALNGLHQLQLAESEQSHLEMVLRLFERDLLETIGYGLGLESCLSTAEAIQKDRYYRYCVGEGAVLSEACEGEDVFIGSSLIALHRGALDNAHLLKDAKRLLKAALAQHLDGRPLKSRKLMLDLLRARRGSH